MTRRGHTLIIGVLFLALAPAATLAQSAKTTLTDPAQARLFNDISDRLICQCGCQMVLRVCNHQNCPSAIPMRREIEEKLLAGESADAIVQGFVDEHGLKVLSAPPAEGLNLAAWIMPGFAVLVGLLIVIHFAGHWAARRRLAEAAPAATIDEETRARVAREIEEMERQT